MTEQITVPRATWDALREALQAVRPADSLSDSRLRLVVRELAALTSANAVSEPQEAIAWEATTPGYIKYVTDRQYRSYSETAKRWYKPYKCSSCTAPKQAEPDPQLCSFYNVSTFPELVAEMEHHIRKLQDKLPVRDVLDFQKARQG